MNTYKCLRALIIFLIIVGWIFSGWPQIWHNPPIPPEIQEAKALTTDTYYGTYDSVKSTMTNPVNAETDNTQYAYGGKNILVVIQSWSGTAGSGTISGVRIYCQHYATTPDGDDYTLVDYSLDDWVTTGTTSGQQVMPASESSFSVDITADRPWTWPDITNLEVRATAKASGKQNFTNDYIDVLYIQVDYTPAPALSITAPASAEFPDFQIGTGTTSTCENMGNIDVQGDNTAWITKAYMEGDFTCSGNTIAVANQLDMDPRSGQSGPYYRTVLTAGTDDTQVSAPAQFTFAGTGSGNQETILSCSATNSGNGEYQITPKLILTVPVSVKACSTYSATIVLTVY